MPNLCIEPLNMKTGPSALQIYNYPKPRCLRGFHCFLEQISIQYLPPSFSFTKLIFLYFGEFKSSSPLLTFRTSKVCNGGTHGHRLFMHLHWLHGTVLVSVFTQTISSALFTVHWWLYCHCFLHLQNPNIFIIFTTNFHLGFAFICCTSDSFLHFLDISIIISRYKWAANVLSG